MIVFLCLLLVDCDWCVWLRLVLGGFLSRLILCWSFGILWLIGLLLTGSRLDVMCEIGCWVVVCLVIGCVWLSVDEA